MSVAGDFLLGLREAFTLRRAEENALANSSRRVSARKFASASKAHRAAARKLANPVVAITLLHEALELAIVATRAARGDDDAAPIDLHAEIFEHDAIKKFLASSSRLYVDELSFSEAEALRDALDAETSAKLAALDIRSVVAVRGLRWGRFLALVMLLTLGITTLLRARFLPHNVALGKPVYTSGLRAESPAGGAEVVDGRTRGTYGVATNDGPHPFVTIDLEKIYELTSIRIFNRGDGWFDDGLPLAVETSNDGLTFTEIARRTTHFDVWSFGVPRGTHARFVRVAKLKPGYVALNEIEIYSRE